MSKISNISGFPEWLPGQKLVEEQIIDRIKRLYRSAGFIPLETPAVELVSTLQAKGAVEKEIYVIKRLNSDGEEKEREELALHFDLTVPFSRYVAQHLAQLTFPFKRYQVQKVWRGERPQKGRYREFYQFDIDVIAREDLPLSCDAEVLDIFAEALAQIGLPRYEIRVNDRKILLGFYAALGLADDQRKKTVAIVDKLDKIGPAGVGDLLRKELSLEDHTIARILDLSTKRLKPEEARQILREFAITDQLFIQGCENLLSVIEMISPDVRAQVVVDLSLARGLDYYTGIIIEVRMIDHPEFGSIGGGGRYEDLASEFISQKLPGVGISIGISRILGFLFDKGLLDTSRASTAEVLVTVYAEEQRVRCIEIARDLRRFGVATEVYFKSPKLGKQLDYADAKGIPYVLFVAAEDGLIQVKDLKTKDQFNVPDLATFAERLNTLKIHG